MSSNSSSSSCDCQHVRDGDNEEEEEKEEEDDEQSFKRQTEAAGSRQTGRNVIKIQMQRREVFTRKGAV